MIATDMPSLRDFRIDDDVRDNDNVETQCIASLRRTGDNQHHNNHTIHKTSVADNSRDTLVEWRIDGRGKKFFAPTEQPKSRRDDMSAEWKFVIRN